MNLQNFMTKLLANTERFDGWKYTNGPSLTWLGLFYFIRISKENSSKWLTTRKSLIFRSRIFTAFYWRRSQQGTHGRCRHDASGETDSWSESSGHIKETLGWYSCTESEEEIEIASGSDWWYWTGLNWTLLCERYYWPFREKLIVLFFLQMFCLTLYLTILFL